MLNYLQRCDVPSHVQTIDILRAALADLLLAYDTKDGGPHHPFESIAVKAALMYAYRPGMESYLKNMRDEWEIEAVDEARS